MAITLASVLGIGVLGAFLLGVPLNAVLLFWAIRKHTPAGLRPYARLLQQTCVTDLVLLTVNLLLNPVSQFCFGAIFNLSICRITKFNDSSESYSNPRYINPKMKQFFTP
jgi:DMSO/TMAO reductase YedYZ heme-binding membrane subunit